MTVGTQYIVNNPDISPITLVALAAVAALPLVMMLNQSSQSAVLLPFIDSANHVQQADSTIEYNPLKDCFQLTIGPNCVDAATSQLFVTYGNKSDAELLLKYGFLPGVSCPQDASEDEQRRLMALEFNKRNQ
jgi:hypothetical protein